MGYSTTDLIKQVQLLAGIPSNQNLFTDQQILDLMYGELRANIFPYIIRQREEWFVRRVDVPILAGVDSYDIPDKASGGVLREVKYVVGSMIIDLTRYDLQNINSVQLGAPTGFYIQGSQVVLFPSPVASSGLLRLFYFERPNKLVPESECGKVVSVAGMTVTGNFPVTWSASNTFDIVRGTGDFRISDSSLSASSVTTSSITVSTAINAIVGSYICLEGETCFPPIPKDLAPLLVQMTVSKIHESAKDAQSLQASESKVQQMMSSLAVVIGQRVQGSPRSITSSLV
jgi:hypothetical protein